jgi:WD40 repeat protein
LTVKVPRFHLARVLENGKSEAPEILSVTQPPWDASMNRRGALGAGLAISTVLAACKKVPEVAASHSACAPETKPPPTAFRDEVTLAVSPDGKHLMTASGQDGLALWSLPDGARLWDDPEPWASGEPTFSPDGLLAIAVIQTEEKMFRARVLRAPGAETEREIDLGRFPTATLSPRGDYLLAGKRDLTDNVQGALFTFPQGERVEAFEEPAMGHPQFTPDGRFLVFEHDSVVRTWSLGERRFLDDLPRLAIGRTTGAALVLRQDGLGIHAHQPGVSKSIASLEHPSTVYATVSASNKLVLLEEGRDPTWRAVSLPDLQVRGERSFHFWNQSKGIGDRKAIAPDDSLVVATIRSNHEDLGVWSLPSFESVATLHLKDRAERLFFTPDSRTLLVLMSHAIQLWAMPDLAFRDEVQVDWTWGQALTPDGKHLIVRTRSEEVLIVPVESPCDRHFLTPRYARGALAARTEPWKKTAAQPPSRSAAAGGRVTSGCACNKVCTCVPVMR